jgi:hypothetical protein
MQEKLENNTFSIYFSGATMLAEVDVVWQSPQMFQHFNLFQPASTLNPI